MTNKDRLDYLEEQLGNVRSHLASITSEYSSYSDNNIPILRRRLNNIKEIQNSQLQKEVQRKKNIKTLVSICGISSFGLAILCVGVALGSSNTLTQSKSMGMAIVFAFLGLFLTMLSDTTKESDN